MKIERLIIQGFGRLREIDLILSPGFQMVYGANEQGKSTIMAFIRAMFYGFAGSSRKLETNERRLYTPWDGRSLGGALIFEHQGKGYRLERQFGKARAGDSTTLMDDTTGKIIELGSQNEPGQHLFDLSENEFTNTVFVRQLSSHLGQSDELLARLSNLAGSGDASVSHAQIDQRIRQAQTDLIAARGRGGKINELTDSLEQMHLCREAAVEAAGQQMQRMQTLQINQKSLEQITCEEFLLQEQAAWQEKMVLAAQWQRVQERRNQLEQAMLEQAEKEQALQYGSQTITASWLGEIRGLEQSWREKDRQLEDRQQSLTKLQEQYNQLVQEGEQFKSVSLLNRTHINVLRNRLSEQKNSAAALKTQVREQESILAELKKQQELADQLRRSSEADQREYDKTMEKARQELAEAENDAQTNAADITQADQEYAQKEDDLQQFRQTIPQDLNTQPGPTCSQRCFLIIAVSLVLALGSGLAAILFSQALIWFAVLLFMLIPLLVWQTERKKLAAGHDESARQNWQQRLYLLESDLRLADSRQESVRRILQLNQRRLSEARQRWHQLQQQTLMNVEKQAASKNSVQQAISRCQARLQAGNIDDMKDELDKLERGIAADESAVSDMLRQNGCIDWGSFEHLLQDYDQYMGKARAMHQTRKLAESQFELAEAEAGKAAAELTDSMSIIRQISKPEDASPLISALHESLGQADLARGKVLQEETRFQDILGDRTLADWEAAISRIQFELSQMQEQPSLLGNEQMHQLRINIGEKQAEQIALREKIAALDSVIRLAAGHQESVSDLDEQIDALESKLKLMRLYYQRLGKAREALDLAAAELQNSFGPQLNQKAGEILAELTAGKYDELKIDRSFMVRLSDPADGNFHEWQYLSGGTIDQVYLALRMAISDLIREQQEQLPLLFDDILIQYDESRTAASLDYLFRKSRQSEQQILLFSCQKRLTTLVESAGWPVIELA